ALRVEAEADWLLQKPASRLQRSHQALPRVPCPHLLLEPPERISDVELESQIAEAVFVHLLRGAQVDGAREQALSLFLQPSTDIGVQFWIVGVVLDPSSWQRLATREQVLEDGRAGQRCAGAHGQGASQGPAEPFLHGCPVILAARAPHLQSPRDAPAVGRPNSCTATARLKRSSALERPSDTTHGAKRGYPTRCLTFASTALLSSS